MNTTVLARDAEGFALDALDVQPAEIILHVHLSQSEAPCPTCQQPSAHPHSQSLRTVRDLPWADRPVVWQFQVRRFYCDNPACTRQTFTEQNTPFIAPHACRTDRLQQAPLQYGFALGGEAGAWLVGQHHMPISPDSLLRLVRQASVSAHTPPRIVGIDDWALRKGQRYGTIMIDLEQHQPIELLPDRTTATVATWLHAHPSIEIVTRDRATAYGDAITQGAPRATQVSDRWHLLQNLCETLQRWLERHHAELKRIQVVPEVPAQTQPETDETNRISTLAVFSSTLPVNQVQIKPASPIPPPPTGMQPSRPRRFANYLEVKRLPSEGGSKRGIAKKLHLHRNTVGRYLWADQFPECNGRAPHPSPLAPYLDYLEERWQAGCQEIAPLWNALLAHDYRGARVWLQRWIHDRQVPPTSDQPGPSRARRPRSGTRRAVPKVKTLSAWHASWLIVWSVQDLTVTEQKQLTLLKTLCANANLVYDLAQAFCAMVRERQSETLVSWLDTAKACGLEDLHNFALALECDMAAVLAALKLPWSNSLTEGHVNRLKLKRAMYGRANFDLLRKRVLHGY